MTTEVRNRIGAMCKNFDEILNYDEVENVEFWYARDLQGKLGYKEWRNFLLIIDKAKETCKSLKIEVSDHFVDVNKTIDMPKNATKDVDDIMLTRYACYLIAQNGDSRKEEIAFAQSYFALQTRKQELIQDRMDLMARFDAREKLRESEKQLSKNIYERGVDDKGFARIRSKGDNALFGGNTTGQMKTKFGVKKTRSLAGFLPTLTIAAKNLATEITNHNVTNEDLKGEVKISNEHVQNNKTVREMLGKRGIKPEELPPVEDIKILEKRTNTENKNIAGKSGKILKK